MEPIPESLEALRSLSQLSDHDMIADLRAAASGVQQLIPDCVAVSFTFREGALTFTLTTTSDETRIVDGAQYLDDGPCEVSARDGEAVEVDDVLDEERWRLFAQASAASGVRSSLSLPLRRGDQPYGSVNLYGSTPTAFQGREGELARAFGAAVGDAVANADLSMASMERARQAPSVVFRADKVDMAVGVLSEREGISPIDARARLLDAAGRSGVDIGQLAELLIADAPDDADSDAH